MKNIFVALLFCSALFLFACDDDGLGNGKWNAVISSNPGDKADVGTVIGGLHNGDMEATNAIKSNLPSGWKDLVNAFNPPNNYDFEHNDTHALGKFSMAISCSNIDSQNEFGFVRQTIVNPDIPVGAFVRLSGAVKIEGLSGNGFNMLVIGYDIDGDQIFRIESFQDSQFATGTKDWVEYVTNINSYPPGLDEIQVILSIGRNTTGTVYFDDVMLEVD